ncbi:MAG: DUF819 family protein [Candidatus Omnitrophica bacterium]|nr:DUF819 family protein [Candidatus Omnitrophota bacterium]
MVNQPLLLLALLIGLVASLRGLAARPRLSRLFNLLPLPFWCYVIPMAATTAGWLPAAHPVYSFLSGQLLPVCLALLLIGTDLKGLARLGPIATCLMLAGSLGTVAGGLASLALYRRWLPADAWGGIGALAGSWIGGSANLLAVKEALHVSDSLIGPIIVVDAVVSYSWMALLIWGSSLAGRWDRLVCARAGGPSLEPAGGPLPPSPSPGLVTGIGLAVSLSLLAQSVSSRLPAIGHVLNPQSWTILLVTTLTLILSLTPLRNLEQAGLFKVGTFALYLLLASIGARASLRGIADAPVFLAVGLTWILIHGICLILAGALLKAPLGLIATASQANIGGPISAPIVGATFSPQLATAGLLMAILGNILGTYGGLMTAALGSWLVR